MPLYLQLWNIKGKVKLNFKSKKFVNKDIKINIDLILVIIRYEASNKSRTIKDKNKRFKSLNY